MVRCRGLRSTPDESYEIDSDSSPDAVDLVPADRPGISFLDRPRDSQSQVKVLPKDDFIKKWLMTVETDRSEGTLSATSIVNASPSGTKRLRSPLRQLNKIKRPKSEDLGKFFLSKHLGSPGRQKSVQKENDRTPAASPSSTSASGLSPRSKLAACRLAIFGPRRNLDPPEDEVVHKTPEETKRKFISSIDQLVISEYQSLLARDVEIESTSSSPPHEPKIPDIDSVVSSQKVDDVIESEFSDEDKPREEVRIEDAGDSDCDRTLDELIEDPEGEFPEIKRNKDEAKSDAISSVDSQDSDRTYFSGGPAERTIIEQSMSQKISDATSSRQGSIVKCSQTISDNSVEVSPSCKRIDLEFYPSMAPKTVKKKKKAKKGSMVERLQTLVNGKISFLRMWRHQMAQLRFKGTCSQCVTMSITKTSISYGRPYFEGKVVSDAFNLVDKSIPKTNKTQPTSADSSDRIITVLTIPEIVGYFSTQEKSALKFYPPWEVIDADKLILSVLYFNVVSDDSEQSQTERSSLYKDSVIQEFDCSCLRAGKLVSTCGAKFCNSKPNVVEYLFK